MIFPRRAIFLRTGFDPLAYANTILGTESANLIGYWPLWEASGATADNYEGTAARDGSYTGVTLGQAGIGDGNPCPLFDGVDDVANIYSASLAGVFSGVAGTMAIWAKVSAVGVWTDSTVRKIINFQADANNRAYFERTATHNRIQLMYRANGTSYSTNIESLSTTDWFHLALTWDKNAGATGQVKAYFNGSQSGVTQTNLQDWAGALAVAYTTIGAMSNIAAQPWSGYLAHAAVWRKALTPAQVLDLAAI